MRRLEGALVIMTLLVLLMSLVEEPVLPSLLVYLGVVILVALLVFIFGRSERN
ncbi:hypothetical protein TCELL_0320 [Thermogladius calderae 1633]|uniref:Uncharacterized protein n=1 Tax=Thermogladius calderae (strain DSM 22663 / VKM B-2946 / 1633) TaxID=1184251 RepID=I3TDA7_THEC1|nr:hypothetical protein [Thermogladius calderae]AFK50745.1 hypothetical protein TCELL_0320 [Thermogladius calderae 1633]